MRAVGGVLDVGVRGQLFAVGDIGYLSKVAGKVAKAPGERWLPAFWAPPRLLRTRPLSASALSPYSNVTMDLLQTVRKEGSRYVQPSLSVNP